MPRPRSERPVLASAGGGSGFVPQGVPAAAAAVVAGRGEGAPPSLPPPIAANESLAYGHHSRVFDVALLRASEDEASFLLASAGEDEVVRVWRRRKKETGDSDESDLDRPTFSTPTSTSSPASSSGGDFEQLAALRGHGEPVLRVAWGPARSGLLASAGGDRAARIWKMSYDDEGDEGDGDDASAAPRSSRAPTPIYPRFRQAAVLPGHPEEVYACEITADSKGCVTASSSSVFLWDLETGQRVSEGKAGGGEGGLSPPQPSGGGNGEADPASSSSPSLPPRWAAAHVFSATLSPKEAAGGNSGGGSALVVAAACSDGCLRLWSLRQSSLFPLSATRAHAAAPAAACCWSRDGNRIAVTGSRSGEVAVVDARTMRVCWRGECSFDDDEASGGGSTRSPSSAMGACFFQGSSSGGDGRAGLGESGDGGKELLAVATGAGRVALFDTSDSASAVSLPVSCLRAERVPPLRSMLCVAALPPCPSGSRSESGRGGNGGGSVLAASGDALTEEGRGSGGGNDASSSSSSRASKWSPASVWES